MPTVFGVQPMPTASFMKYTNSAATDKDVDSVLKIKQEKDKDELKRQELLLKTMKNMSDTISDQSNALNLKPYTAYQKEHLARATEITNNYIKRLKDIIDSGEPDPVQLAQEELEYKSQLNDPDIKNSIRESQQLTEMQNQVFKDKNQLYDPDATNEYLNELTSVNTPLTSVDYARIMNVPLDETVEGIVKKSTYDGPNEINDLTNPFGKLADTSYKIINGKAIKDEIISRAAQSPSFRNKILKTGKTVEEYADDQVKNRVAGAIEIPGQPGIYKVQGDSKFTEVSPEKDATSAAKKGSDGSTTKQTDVNYEKVVTGMFENTAENNPGKSIDPLPINYYKKLSDDATDVEKKLTAVNEQLKTYTAYTTPNGDKIIGKFIPSSKKGEPGTFIRDASGNVVDFSEEYSSLLSGHALQSTYKANISRLQKEIEDEANKKYGNVVQLIEDAKKKYTYAQFQDDINIYSNDATPELYEKEIARRINSDKVSQQKIKEYHQYKEDLAKEKMGVNSFSPTVTELDTKDYDYKTFVAPLRDGSNLISADMTVITNQSEVLKGKQLETLKNTNFIIKGIVQDPWSGNYMYELESYTPAENKDGGYKNNGDELTKDRQRYEKSLNSKGETFYAYNAKLQQLMWNTKSGSNSSEFLRNTMTSMLDQISKTGVAYFAPGQLDESEVSVIRNTSDASLFDVYFKEGDITKSKTYTSNEVTKFFEFFRDKKVKDNVDKAKMEQATGVNPLKLDKSGSPIVDTKDIPKNVHIYNTNDATYTMLSKGEGNADGTTNAKSSNDPLGTTGIGQIHRSWEGVVTGKRANPFIKAKKVYAATWEEFQASPTAQRKFYDELLKPDADLAVAYAKKVSNTEYGKQFFKNVQNDINRKYKINVNFLVETENGTHVDEDLVRYIAHNMGSDAFINAVGQGTISDRQGKLKQIATAAPKINNFRKDPKETYLVSGINYLVRPPQNNNEELINYKHLDSLNKILKADKRLVLSDGFRMKKEKQGAKNSLHKDGLAYDFSLKGYRIEVNANLDKNGANLAALQEMVNEKFPPSSLPPDIERLVVHQFPPDEEHPEIKGNYHIHVEFKK